MERENEAVLQVALEEAAHYAYLIVRTSVPVVRVSVRPDRTSWGRVEVKADAAKPVHERAIAPSGPAAEIEAGIYLAGPLACGEIGPHGDLAAAWDVLGAAYEGREPWLAFARAFNDTLAFVRQPMIRRGVRALADALVAEGEIDGATAQRIMFTAMEADTGIQVRASVALGAA